MRVRLWSRVESCVLQVLLFTPPLRPTAAPSDSSAERHVVSTAWFMKYSHVHRSCYSPADKSQVLLMLHFMCCHSGLFWWWLPWVGWVVVEATWEKDGERAPRERMKERSLAVDAQSLYDCPRYFIRKKKKCPMFNAALACCTLLKLCWCNTTRGANRFPQKTVSSNSWTSWHLILKVSAKWFGVRITVFAFFLFFFLMQHWLEFTKSIAKQMKCKYCEFMFVALGAGRLNLLSSAQSLRLH